MKKLFLLILMLLTVVIVNLWHIKLSNAQDQLQIDTYDCRASDVTALQKCVQEVNEKKRTIITLVKEIKCLSKLDCEFNIENTQDLLIQGLAEKATGISRQGADSYFVFTVKNSNGVRFEHLFFGDENNNCKNTDCGGAIKVVDSENLLVSAVNMRKIKDKGISLEKIRHANITYSNFDDSYGQAIYISESSGVRIDSNSIQGSRSHGIWFKSENGRVDENSILNNQLAHNHNSGDYVECDSPCNAGQISVDNGVSNLLIEKNKIGIGLIDDFDKLGLFVSGIEINGGVHSKVIVRCNQISNNKGNGIVSTAETDLLLESNAVSNNGININLPRFSQTESSTSVCS